MNVLELSWVQLAIGFLAMLIPAAILRYYRTDLLGKLGTALLRMTLQLLFVGYYLEVIFKYDNPWINAAWILVMVTAADFSTLDRSGLKRRRLFWPIFAATFIGIVLIDFYFLELVIQLPKLLQARYTIPVTGMILGNCLRSNVIGIHAFYHKLRDERERYHYYLACGATRAEALFPFFRDALQQAANPTLAAMATIGLVSLPGMMTGQILGGSSPMTAIKYQIMIMLAIFSGTMLSVFLAIWISNRYVFDGWDRFDDSILK